VSGVASPLRMENQGKLWSVCHLSMDALHPMLQVEWTHLLRRTSSYASQWSYVNIILLYISLLNTSRNIIRVCLIILKKDFDEVVAGNRLTNDMDSHFKGDFSNHYHERLNRFMVDYDIVPILKNHVGYSSWDDVPFNQKELCCKNYNSKMLLPNWNGDEERYSAWGAIALIFFKFWIICIFGSCPWLKQEEWWYVVICANFSNFE
jgi:hypothetical protein